MTERRAPRTLAFVGALALSCASVWIAACAGARGPRGSDVVVIPTIGSAPSVTATTRDPPPPRAPADRTIIRGIDGIEVGQSVSDLRRRLGEELRIDSFDKERAAFTGAGYDVDRIVPFILGFDEVFVFNDDTLRSEPPIWKVYVKEGRAVVVKITTVGFDEWLTEHKVGFPPSCFLLDPPAGIFTTFGQSFLEEQLSDHVSYHFVDRGLTVMVFSEAIRVFDVFGDIGDEARAKIRDVFSHPAPKP